MASTEDLIRWAGASNLLAGATLVLHVLLHPVGSDAVATQGALWYPSHVIGFAGFVLGMFGLVGLFARQAGAFGRGGVAAFAAAYAGQTMTAGVVFFDSFVAPVLGRDAPAVLALQGPLFGGPVGLVILVAGLAVTMGFLGFGVATLRAGLLPKGGAVLLIAGCWFGLGPIVNHYAFVVGGLLFGAGSAWLGYALWAAPKSRAQRMTLDPK